MFLAYRICENDVNALFSLYNCDNCVNMKGCTYKTPVQIPIREL